MLRWIAETTAVTAVLALVLSALCRRGRWGPASRHALWLIVLLRFVTPSVGQWPRPFQFEKPGARATVEPPAPAMSPVSLDTVAADPPPLLEPEVVLIAVPIAEHEPEAPASSAAYSDMPSPAPWPWPSSSSLAIGVWAGGALVLAIVSLVRLVRVRALVRHAAPAPEWLWLETERLAETFGLGRAPRPCLSPESTSPFVWCLGRPRLVLPESLVNKLSLEQWRGILAHELAHLRRRDHWVSWLILGASLPWWWNPIFWLVRRRLEADAELACDAWAVGAVPDGRRPFALALVEVACGSRSAPCAPALGMSGAGRFLERRLIMILREHVPYRSSRSAALAAVVLGLLALPAWTRAQDEPRRDTPRDPGPPRASDGREKPRDNESPRAEGRSEERRENSAEERSRRDRIDKARAEIRQIEEQLGKARQEFEEHVHRRQEELQREVDADSKQLHERMEQLSRAQRELAELEGRPRTPERRVAEELRLRLRRPDGANPFGSRDRPGAERRENRIVELRDRPRDGDDLERRMDRLERRFEELLGELRSQRRPPGQADPSRR